MAVSVIPSEQFLARMEQAALQPERENFRKDEEEREEKKKGPSRRLSKKEKRKRAALKKL
jgi:hypothetical protein